VVGATELASTAVSEGDYGNATQVAQITVDADGRLTSASNVSISFPAEDDPEVGELADNVVPYWNGTTLINGTMYDVGGNVGIGTTAPERLLSVGTAPSSGLYITRAGNAGVGTTAPAYELDVTGDIRSTGTIYGDLAGNLTGGYAAAGWVDDGGVVRLETDSDNVGIGTSAPERLLSVGTAPSSGLFVTRAGNVGIGTTSPIEALEVAGQVAWSGNILPSGTGTFNQLLRAQGDGSIVWQNESAGGWEIQDGNTVRLNNDSYVVGIGTTLPLNKVHVQGSGGGLAGIYMNSAVPANTSYTLYNEGGTLKWNNNTLATGASVSGTPGFIGKFTATDAIGDSVIFEDGATGNVGIGWTLPTARLFIAGAGSDAGFALRVTDELRRDRLIVQDNGNVGIGLTNPNAKLQVNGTINATAMNVGANAVLDEGTSFAGDVTGPWDSLEIASGV
ncbi:MAG: hypothetical protein MJA29_05095, partial [Candidatus Omnitrophica bacterium]|nr:hypothetical protein [Candidatus Omnitrophota bacterium]